MGLEFNRAAHLLTTMIKVPIVKGEDPGIWAAFKQTLNDDVLNGGGQGSGRHVVMLSCVVMPTMLS